MSDVQVSEMDATEVATKVAELEPDDRAKVIRMIEQLKVEAVQSAAMTSAEVTAAYEALDDQAQSMVTQQLRRVGERSAQRAERAKP